MDVPEIQYRWMEPAEVGRIGDIDRSELVRTGFKYSKGRLQQMDVNWNVSAWLSDGGGDHTIVSQIRFCQDHLQRNGQMYGAFDGEKLVGLGLIQHEIRENMAQLAFLHVSNEYRRRGIGARITEELTRAAKEAGAEKIYVTATPSASAVGFYLRNGFAPAADLIPELFELEPDDIHMIKTL